MANGSEIGCNQTYTEMQKKLTTCLKCNKIVTVQNKTNQQLLIETLAFYWWHVKFLTKIHHLISLFYSTEQHRVQCQSPFNSVCGHHCFGYRQCIVGAYCLPVFGWIAAGFCPTQSSMSEAIWLRTICLSCLAVVTLGLPDRGLSSAELWRVSLSTRADIVWCEQPRRRATSR